MQIDFYYYEDCPSHDAALVRLRGVLARLGMDAQIIVTQVETEEEAERYQFIGSPTIRVNGQDIDPPPADTPYALDCRVYRREDGRITPLPTEALIEKALLAAQAPPR